MNNKNKFKIAGSNPPFKGGRGDFLTLKIISFFLFLFTQCTKKDYNIINLNSPNIETADITNILTDSATVNFKIINTSKIKFNQAGICYDTNDNPTIAQYVQYTDSGVLAGNYSVVLPNLLPAKKYYVRGFSTYNNAIYYGNVQSFTTNNLPIIALNILNITNNTATINWVITNSNKTNITKVGIYYSTSNMLPGTNSNDSTKILNNTGSLAGTYSLDVNNLIKGSTYYIRFFYVINGVQYLSPQVQSFTAIILPTIATNTITNITKNAVTTGITITNVGNVNIAAAGLCYSKTNTIPTLADSLKTLANTGVLNGIYPMYLSNLSFNTVYYVRSYYTVNGLTYYGNVQNFTTLQNIPQVQTDTAINITNNSATINFSITNETALNITAAGIAYSSSNTSPTTASGYVAHSSTGNLAGNYSLTLSSLSANTIYYYRAYINYNGIIYYGATKMFSSNPNLPTITTNTTTAITQTTALASVNIANTSNVNIAEIGFCCSKINNIPTIVDSLITLPNTGNLTGNYTINVTNLSTNSLYYIRGYIKYNNAIYYGNVQNFTTLAILPQVSTNGVTNIANTSATGNINISNPNGLSITAAGVAYSSSNSTPTTANGYVSLSSVGNLAGNYTIWLSSLSANTTYYVRAYINYNGTIYYGSVQTFTTLQNPPTITTNAVTSITNIAATGNINISNPNGLSIAAAGIVYSNINNIPTISDNFIAHSSVGNLAGNYTINLSSLIANTTYYVRAYINYKGTIYYGALQTFTTLQNPPTITTNAVTSITNTTATGNINISNPNGLSIAAAGIVYSNINNIPTISDNFIAHSSIGNLAGNYTIYLSSLTAITTYYVRAYINYKGTIYYGALQTFTTLQNPPTITTNAVTSITNTTATANINISNPNVLSITAVGVAYSSTNSTPTIANGYVAHSNTGNLAGNYTLGLSGLTVNTTYYVRAYINYNGTIYYGAVQTFTTLQNPPTITTNAVTSITNTTATANINISNPNVLSITAAGVAYSSTNSTPTIANGYVAHNSTGNLAGNYTLILSSLTANTTYYIRAYINYNGIIYYGSVQNFTTTNLPTTLTLANLEANMVTVPAGNFTMGATSEQIADGYNPLWSPATQQVTLSTYKICRFEVTQQLWQDVMSINPSYFTGNLQRPVESVSWNDCQTFISKLNQLTGKTYRLPTEAEWEYAARGGANSTYSYIYSGSNILNDVAWNNYNSSSQTQTVGTKQANALGLYDMSGNVWEWCNDWYGNYSNTAVTNPQGPATGSGRVLRGGFWNSNGYQYRVSYRFNYYPSNSSNSYGIRLVFSSN